MRNKRIWVAGHQGLVGQALVRALPATGASVLTVPRFALDMREQQAVRHWLRQNNPDVAIIAAATVGGIGDNQARPADFIYDNMMIAANIMHESAHIGLEKLLFLGSSCIYPRDAMQPIGPESLLSGPLEPSNEAYAVAKIAGIKMAQSYARQYGCRFISAMPCNLYGPGDRFDMKRSHVIPALMMKMDVARRQRQSALEVWGTGTPLREFLHVDDLAAALILLLQTHEGTEPVNVGSGQEISIADLATLIAEITGYEGDIRFSPAYPDGTPRKILDSAVMRGLGWRPEIDLRRGLMQTYDWFLQNKASAAEDHYVA
ncbi:MAG: GDP-L-fucose synthase [Micavibrio aeruginosavorus]|uniref:GDP-L-fucose synthase n=1 Tax=Micavibrio aeruginosavorus TaxID=349221 RepID=A0A7T5R4G4_9BACT|nr:MAG: GDP-L-fucose synthase [Micavibrio aeruginosavorus]